MNEATAIELSDEQRSELERRVRSQTIDARVARRARIVLLAAAGVGNHEIARRMEISRGQVISWRRRFAQGGVAAIDGDLPRSGRKWRIDAAEIVRLTTQTMPKGAATHWSARTLAAHMGISDTTVHKAWKAHGIKPHLVETFKVSCAPQFAEKLEDIVGLSPPRSMRWCCGAMKKARCRRLDRTQPGQPLKKGKAATMTHDYKRHDTTTLFAAMSTLDGMVISRCAQRHRDTEWLDFLRQIDRETPKEKELHLASDL